MQRKENKNGEYNPTLEKYDPVKDACWKKGDPVPYYALSRTLQCCEDTSGRLAKTEFLANFFRSVLVLRLVFEIVHFGKKKYLNFDELQE
jgi:hypothetical protein